MGQKYYPIGNTSGVLPVEVYLTAGPDPVIVHMLPDDAARVVDWRDVERATPLATPRQYEYNVRLTVFITRLSNEWPYRRPPSWAELTDILNGVGMLTYNGMPWTRPNLIQKMQAMGLSKETIVNPEGDYGQTSTAMPDMSGELSLVRGVVSNMEASLPANTRRAVGDEGGPPVPALPGGGDLYSEEDM